MEFIDLLQKRLAALSLCSGSHDLQGRASLVATALNIDTTSPQFLSNLYDVCVSSVVSLPIDPANGDSAVGEASRTGDAAACDNPSSQLCLTCTAAALHYLPGQGGSVLQQFLDAFYLPLLARSDALPGRAFCVQACDGLSGLLVSGNHWQQLRQLAAQCFLALNVVPATSAMAPSTACDPSGAQYGGTKCNLPLPVACVLLTSLVKHLRAASEAHGVQDGSAALPHSTSGAAATCMQELRDLLLRLRAVLRPMLVSNTATLRRTALKALVPSVLTCAQACGGKDLAATAQVIWELGLELLAGGGTATAPVPAGTGAMGTTSQRTALALLVAACPLLQHPDAHVDVQACGRFWELLRTCLALTADVAAVERKRALLLMQRLASPDQLSQPGWALWAALYDILDEFPIHLVAPMWAKVDQLHAPAPEYRTETVVPKSYIPRKKELKQRKATAAAPATDGADAPTATDCGDGVAAGAPGSAAVPMDWQCVLWARALQHGNVQVQRLVLRTLLQRDWRAAGALQGVPVDFVTGVLLPSLTRDHHYRGGAAAADVVDVQAAAAVWLHAWFASAPVEQRLEGLLALRCVVVGSDLSRVGLEQVLRGIAAAARGAAADGQLVDALVVASRPAETTAKVPPAAAASTAADTNSLTASNGAAASGSVEVTAATFPGAMLAALRAVLVYLGNFTGLSYKRSVWRSVLVTAAAVTPPTVVGVSGCLRLLLELPASTLEPGGEMRGLARAWLLGRSILESDDNDAAPAPTIPGLALTPSEAAAIGSCLRSMLAEYWTPTAPVPLAAPGADAVANTSAAAVSQLLMLFDDVEAACTTVLQKLQQALYGMHGRPYLQASEVDSALGLLREVLRMAPLPPLPPSLPPSDGTSDRPPAAADPSSALQSGLLGLLSTCCEDLCSAASHAADAFLTAEPSTASGTLTRADTAWCCVALSLTRVSRHPGTATAPIATRLANTLLALLSRLCRSPLPATRRDAVVVAFRAATASAEALRQAAACSPAVRALAAERLDASALAAAVLRDAAAASTAATPTATGARREAEPSGEASQALVEVEAVKWPLLDAVTACALECGMRPGVRAQGSEGGGVRTGGLGGLEGGPMGVVLAQAVAALSEYPEGQVLPLLRCLRRCWVAVAAAGRETQVSAAKALGEEAQADQQPLEALCWPVVRALWNALCATTRRTGPLCAAFVNTALLPCLYVQQDTSLLTALHGSAGPCRWLLSRLLEWGGTSSRFLLLLACQLGSFLPLQPALVECYSREIQLLLLWGSRKGSSYDPDTGSIEVVEAEELASVAPPLQPGLVGSPAIATEVAPRVALLCFLHQLAEMAGCVWPPPRTQASDDKGATAATGAGAAATAATAAAMSGLSSGPASAVTESSTTAAKRRPVIIFGDASGWDEHGQSSPATGAAVSAANGGYYKAGAEAGSRRASDAAVIAAAADANGEALGDGVGTDYGAPPPPDPEHPALRAGQLLWRQLLAVALNDPLLSTDKVRNGSELHRQKVRLWQSLVVLSSFVPRSECGPAVEAMLAQVNGNNPPTVKQYIEAVVAALVLREPSLLQSQLLPMLSTYSRHISGLGSYILIAAQVLLHSPPAVQARELQPLLLALCPWLTCHGHNVRTYAQLIMWALLQRFPPDSPLWAHSIGDLGYLRHMLAFMQTNVDLVRLRKNIGEPILEWSPAGMASPARVFATSPDGVSLAGTPNEHATFEGAPATLVDRIHGFLVTERHRLRDELSDRSAEREFAPQDPTAASTTTTTTTTSTTAGQHMHTVGAGTCGAAGAGGGAGVGEFQRKITPEALLAALEGPGLAAGGGGGRGGDGGGLAAWLQGDDDEAHDWKSAPSSRAPRHDVLLVASLIDKVPNLAGLARTCEVLGAGRLVLADLGVAKDPVFTSVSVTAEQWLPMEEVKPAALLAWLERKTAEGYTLVGLEQTSESVRLPDYRWPSRVVLVLGREKEGIPPEVLSRLDATLEIPQCGIVRSLNVHVTGAIALYEYVRQSQPR